MPNDFEFLQNPVTKKWVISAPGRAKRPNVAKETFVACPFCGNKEESIFEIEAKTEEEKKMFDVESKWLVKIIRNKFPFAPVHEIIVHSPNHDLNIDTLPTEQVELLLKAYRYRYQLYHGQGKIFLFHNRGKAGGESLPHAHTQLVVIPQSVTVDTPSLDPDSYVGVSPKPIEIHSLNEKTNALSLKLMEKEEMIENDHFYLFCPDTCQWPDEVWIAPKRRGYEYGDISDGEIKDFARILKRLIQIMDLRHGKREFAYNYYINPGKDWYLRFIPRQKTIGGFELVTGIFVNTQNPKETLDFLKAHFHDPDEESIKKDYQADYRSGV
ncbi:hypothetical protein M1307_03910 [Patescibacteria group bacterium]|nr:hypothetical protein [Patescibacteria group bacterium]